MHIHTNIHTCESTRTRVRHTYKPPPPHLLQHTHPLTPPHSLTLGVRARAHTHTHTRVDGYLSMCSLWALVTSWSRLASSLSERWSCAGKSVRTRSRTCASIAFEAMRCRRVPSLMPCSRNKPNRKSCFLSMSGALPVVITGGREGIQESLRTQNRIWPRARVRMVRRANSGSRESGNAGH